MMKIMFVVVSMAIHVHCTIDIHLFGLFPMEGQYAGGLAQLPAAMMAVDDINKRQDILPGYRLHMKWNNSKCNKGVGVKALADSLYTQGTSLMVIGGACSAVSEATARVSHLWNLVQISYGSVSPSLSNKKVFPKFFRVISPEANTNKVRVKLFKHFGWNRIAIISENMDLFSSATEDLIQKLNAENITVLSHQFFSDPTIDVRALKNQDARIIVGNFYPRLGREVICQAFRVGLYGRKVVWLLPGWFYPHWYTEYNDTANCTTQDILKVTENAFSLDNVYYNPSDDVSISNMTSSQFRSRYTDLLDRTTNSTFTSGYERAPAAYDVIWAAAIALNQTNNYLIQTNDSLKIENFTYTDKRLGQLIFDNVRKLNFTGIPGNVQFDDHGDPRSLISIRVLRDSTHIRVGVGDTTDRDIQWLMPSTDFTVFRDGRVPVDSVRVEERVITLLVDITYIYGCVIVDGRVPVDSVRVEERVITLLVDITYIYGRDGRVPVDSVRVEERVITLPVPVYIAMCCLAGAAMFLAIAFLVFNVVCRNERIIKMSSPNLNNVILSGCVITYTGVFLTDLNSGNRQCQVFQARIFVLTIGFSMTFGALFAKTWRVYVIFTTNFKVTTNKVYKDWSLFLMVGILVLVNSGILLAWILMDSISITHHTLTPETVTDADVLIQPVVHLCSSPNSKFYLGPILGVLGTLLLYGVFLAWETRKVHVEVLNDSRYIGMCIYNTVVLGVMGVFAFLALRKEVLIHYSVESTVTILATAVTQTLIFVPKISAYRNENRLQKGTAPSVVKTMQDLSQDSFEGTPTPHGSYGDSSEFIHTIQGTYPDSTEATQAMQCREQHI
ncbi:gamma-aminobutyric acid type B receptor subunit 1-like [Haliotis rufescens]|uniref:gamma-aminobutyric acid type B receptor subunit 1-like n=1 Tax=Haliotis rufescens TaxID=6454 RepID=UPI00201F600E|nr:gamma-aminobutyric acid type B receptor subunit 1-like [Haliotis rufescens]